VRDPRGSQAERGRESAFVSSRRLKGGENAKAKQQSKILARDLPFRKCLRSVTKVVSVRQEQSTGLSVSMTPSLRVTHRQLSNNYQVLRALVPRAPGLAHWPPKTQNNELLLEKSINFSTCGRGKTG